MEMMVFIQTGISIISLIVSLLTLKTVTKSNSSKQIAIGKGIKQKNEQ